MTDTRPEDHTVLCSAVGRRTSTVATTNSDEICGINNMILGWPDGVQTTLLLILLLLTDIFEMTETVADNTSSIEQFQVYIRLRPPVGNDYQTNFLRSS